MKFGLLILLVIVVALWLNHGARLQRQKDTGRHRRQRSHAPRDPEFDLQRNADGSTRLESIVGCQQCGLHVPASEAVFGLSGASFCCPAHRLLHSQA